MEKIFNKKSKARVRIIYTYNLLEVDIDENTDITDIENVINNLEKKSGVYTTQFPIIIKSDGNIWELAALYFNKILMDKENIRGDVLISIAYDLLDYYRFIENNELDFLYFPKLKNKRVTYQYKRHLIESLNLNNDKGRETFKQRINSVVNLYRDSLEYGLLTSEDFENKPFKEIMRYIKINNSFGFEFNKEVPSSDLAIKGVSSSRSADRIYDGGALRPLTSEEQIILSNYLYKYATRQLQLICSIGFHTGARIQTICTIKVKNIKDLWEKNHNKKTGFIMKVGLGTGVDTKNGKNLTLEFPKWLVEDLYNYLNSELWQERARRSFYGVNDNNYLFLTKFGMPFYTSNAELYDIRIESEKQKNKKKIKIYSGNAVRKSFSDLLKIINKDYPEFEQVRIHDLRATFGMNIVTDLHDKGLNHNIIVDYVKKRMGHSNIKTTMMYLDYKEVLSKHIETQNLFESNLFKYVR